MQLARNGARKGLFYFKLDRFPDTGFICVNGGSNNFSVISPERQRP